MVVSGRTVKESESPEHISRSSSVAPSEESDSRDQNKEVAGAPPSAAVPVPSPSAAGAVPSPGAPPELVTVTASPPWPPPDRHPSADTPPLVAPHLRTGLKSSSPVPVRTAAGVIL